MLRLVHEEDQQHDQHQDHGQILLAVVVVVFHVIAMVLQRIESFVLDRFRQICRKRSNLCMGCLKLGGYLKPRQQINIVEHRQTHNVD